MKVALVHDYLIEYGGAERVLESLAEIFPEAPIYTAYCNLDLLGPHKERVKNWDIRTSWLQRLPFAGKLVSPFRIFAPMIFESFDLKEYDLVISSCNTYFSKAVITRPDALHLSYIHTPPRYLYGYTTSYNYKKHWWTKVAGELMNHFLRIYDFETSQRPDVLIANSKNVAARVKKFYRREAKVIYPPVEIQGERVKRKGERSYFLSLSRLVRGKGVETIVVACDKLSLPLKVAGSGPELEKLKSLSGNQQTNIEFLGHVSDEEREELLANAKALIVASEDEDFGITAVEAFGAGTPVIAIKTGGFLETVIEGKTGEFFDPGENDEKNYINEETVNNLVKVLENFDSSKYKYEDLIKQAEKFSKEKFKKGILELINENYPKR